MTNIAYHRAAALAIATADAQSAISAPEPCDPRYMQDAFDAAAIAAQSAETIARAGHLDSPMSALWLAIAASWRAVQHADTLQQMRAGAEAAEALIEVLADG